MRVRRRCVLIEWICVTLCSKPNNRQHKHKRKPYFWLVPHSWAGGLCVSIRLGERVSANKSSRISYSILVRFVRCAIGPARVNNVLCVHLAQHLAELALARCVGARIRVMNEWYGYTQLPFQTPTTTTYYICIVLYSSIIPARVLYYIKYNTQHSITSYRARLRL